MRENLEPSLKLMFGHEGGYSNRKTDSGGPTKYGITHKTLANHRGVPSVTPAQVKAMTLDEAAEIYRRSYWQQSGGDILPAGLDYSAFDFGVNSGPMTGAKKLQNVLGVKEDGWIGEATLKAIASYDGGVPQLIRDYCERRMAYLKALKGAQGFSANGRGWTIRVTGVDPKGIFSPEPGVIGNALAMAAGAPVKRPSNIPNVGGDSKAMPVASNPWTKPEVLGPVGGVMGGLPAILSVEGPIRYVFAAGLALAILLGAFYAFKRIVRTEP